MSFITLLVRTGEVLQRSCLNCKNLFAWFVELQENKLKKKL